MGGNVFGGVPSRYLMIVDSRVAGGGIGASTVGTVAAIGGVV